MSIISDPNSLVIFPVLLSTAVAFLNVLIEKILNKREMAQKLIYLLSFISTLFLLGLTGLFVEYYFTTSNFTAFSTAGTNFAFLNLVIDEYSLFFFSIVTVVFSFVVWFSIFYMNKDHTPGIYFGLLFAIYAGLISILSVADFFSLFIAWEIMTLASYALVAYDKKTKVSLEAGLKYLIMSSFGSLSFLYGFSLIYGTKGTLSFSQLQTISVSDNYIDSLAMVCIVIGFGVTASFIFLNQWLPDAHPSAPSPVSAILSGVVVKMGIYGIFRTSILIFPQTGLTNQISNWYLILILIGIATIIEGTIMFLIQLRRTDYKDFKRILAYSTTIHLGYILVGIGTGGTLGIVASFFYILNHAFTKGLLFLVSGYLILKLGTRNMDELKGIGRKDTFIGVVLAIGIMSLAGLPGTGGFIAKILIILSLANTYSVLGNITIILLVLVVLSATLAFIAGLWLVKYLIFDEAPVQKTRPIPTMDLWSMRGILGAMAIVTIVLGFVPGPVISSLLVL